MVDLEEEEEEEEEGITNGEIHQQGCTSPFQLPSLCLCRHSHYSQGLLAVIYNVFVSSLIIMSLFMHSLLFNLDADHRSLCGFRFFYRADSGTLTDVCFLTFLRQWQYFHVIHLHNLDCVVWIFLVLGEIKFADGFNDLKRLMHIFISV